MNENLNNLIKWIQKHEYDLIFYKPTSDHSVLKYTSIIDSLIISIKKGQLNAINLGCELAIDNNHIPFGKIFKESIFNSLKPYITSISKAYKHELTLLCIKYLNHPYPAKEVKSLCKLIGKFEVTYINYIILHVSSKSIYTNYHIEYLKAQGKK